MNYSHWISRKGFTSKLKSYFYILPLTRENTVLAALLARLLERGSGDYPSAGAIQNREDELYGAAAYFDVNIYGSFLVFEGRLIYPNYLFFDKPDLEVEALDFLDNLLHKPLLDKGTFKKDFFEQERDMLRQDLESLLKDPPSYAMRKAMELLYGEDKLGFYRYGDLKTLEEVNMEMLMDFYQTLLKSPQLSYYYGDEKREDLGLRPSFDMDRVVEVDYKGEVFEDLDIGQSSTVFVYGLGWPYKDERVYPSLVFSHLLGGMASSFLFKRIREDLGLCYSIYSRYDRYRQLLFIVVGHDKNQYGELKRGIEEVIEEFRQGDFSHQDLKETKQDLVIGLGSITDSQSRHLRDIFIRDLFGDIRDIESRMEKIKQVDKDQLVDIARKLELKLIYSVRNR